MSEEQLETVEPKRKTVTRKKKEPVLIEMFTIKSLDNGKTFGLLAVLFDTANNKIVSEEYLVPPRVNRSACIAALEYFANKRWRQSELHEGHMEN